MQRIVSGFNPLALVIPCLALGPLAGLAGEPRVLDGRLHHLRIEGPREWSEFPAEPEAPLLEIAFEAQANAAEHALELRQQDVKQTWTVSLNGKQLGRLPRDENDMLVYYAIPPGGLATGRNTLRIEQDSRSRASPDDVRIGQLTLHDRPRDTVLSQARVKVEVLDADTGAPLPARVTMLDADGALQSVGAVSDDHLAVRPGTVYTADGRATFGLPPGTYTLYAGRGFEYSLASAKIELAAGETVSKQLTIRREVPTHGYVACDTHVHSLTHSGHGDATVQERMITIAAEGIELPIATDHNVHVDHDPFARAMNVRQHFTPVIGNEVTTRVGHFNIFPVARGAPPPDHTPTDWRTIFANIYRTPGVKVVILNHARDLHGGTRPFGPELFNDVVGENLEGWRLRAAGMEVVNSGATQTDVMRLVHDWMALLNRGRLLAPVGSSDSHDVGRHFVGQGRTYIRCDDRDPAAIDVAAAVNSFLQGHVVMSYGLFCDLKVDGRWGPGEMAPAMNEQVQVDVRVLAPHWIAADEVELYANGQRIERAEISTNADHALPPGVKWKGSWTLPRGKHDVHLVAVARGPGIDGLYWKTAKAYQPTSPDWRPHVISCSGAVWLDADGDGRPTPARDYAQRLVAASGGKLGALLASLADYDQAVAAQAAHLVQTGGQSLLDAEAARQWGSAAPAVRLGFKAYLDAWRKNQRARAGR